MKTGIFLSFISAGLAACAIAQDSAIVARAGETELKADEIRAAIENLNPRDQSAIARDPALLNQTVRMLLVQRLVLAEAIGKQWEKQPGVAAQIERAREAVITESYLQSVSKVPEPSEEELKTAYESNKSALVVPRQVKLAQVYLAAPKTAEGAAIEKDKARLESVRKALRAPNADFAAVARAQSDEKTSAAQGGEIGWLAESQMQPEIRAKAADLAKGSVSEPIRMKDGWHILKCLDIREERTAAFDEVRGRLTDQLRAERVRAAREAYLAKLLREKPVSLNELALPKVLKTSEK